MLEDRGQHDQPPAHRPFAKDAGAADAKIRLAAGDRFGDLNTGTTLADGDVETGLAVETLLKRRVVAGKLELMLPFELQGYRIERCGRMRCQHDEASGLG